MVDPKQYFQDAESWDGGYAGKGGKDFLTKIANKMFRKNLMNMRAEAVVKLAMPVKDKIILDAGCGTGRIAELFYDLQPKSIVGFDYAENMITEANEIFKTANKLDKVRFEVGDITKYKINADIIIIVGVVDYFEKFTDALTNVFENGHETIIVSFMPKTTKNINCLIFPTLAVLWGKIRGLKLRKISNKKLISFMEKNGYKETKHLEDSYGKVIRFDKSEAT